MNNTMFDSLGFFRFYVSSANNYYFCLLQTFEDKKYLNTK